MFICLECLGLDLTEGDGMARWMDGRLGHHGHITLHFLLSCSHTRVFKLNFSLYFHTCLSFIFIIQSFAYFFFLFFFYIFPNLLSCFSFSSFCSLSLKFDIFLTFLLGCHALQGIACFRCTHLAAVA